MAHCVFNPAPCSMRAWQTAALLAGLALQAPAASIADTLDARHGGPVIGLFGLPAAGEMAPLGPEQDSRLDFLLQTSSHALREERGGEELLLDGETWRVAVRWRSRVRDRFEISLEVPWLRHTGGNLDGLIDDWHALFGLPDGIRDQRPADELRYTYRDAAGSTLEFTDRASGLGDIRLGVGWVISRDERRSLAIRAVAELPTGDADDLTGNGATDYSLAIAWHDDALDQDGRWSAFLGAGLLRFGETDIPGIRSEDWGGWLQAGLGWRLTTRIELLGLLQAASSPLDTDLAAWGDGSLMLALGAGIDLGDRYHLQLGFTEDIDVETSPDISFMIRLTRR